MSINERIKKFRTEKGISTYELSKLTGISQSTISKLENGKRKTDNEILNKIADALEINVDRLTGESVSCIIEDKLEETGMTLDQVATKAVVPLYWLQNIDTFTPGEWGGENDVAYKWISQVAEAIGLPSSIMRAALARQEIPAYDGPVGSIEEDFVNMDFNGDSIDKLSQKETALLSNFNKLNDIGQHEASKRVEELSYIDKYKINELSETMNQFKNDFKESKANKLIKTKFKNPEKLEKLIRETNSDATITVIDKYDNEILIAAHNDNQSKEQQEKMKEDAKKIRHLTTE